MKSKALWLSSCKKLIKFSNQNAYNFTTILNFQHIYEITQIAILIVIIKRNSIAIPVIQKIWWKSKIVVKT